MKKLIFGISSAAIGLAFLAVPAFATYTSVVIQPNNMQGWAFINDQTNGAGTGTFVNGPATPPLGAGSAKLTVSGPTDGQILALGQLGGTKLSDLTTLTYWTYQDLSNTSNNTAIALQFNVVSDVSNPTPSWQGRIVYEPYYNNGGTVPLGSWKEWDAINGDNGLWWFSGPSHFGGNCPQSSPCTWSHILSLYPNIGVNPTYPGIVFKTGSGWAAFSGNVDAFTIGVSGNDTTYNFEPISMPTDKNQCKNDGWKNYIDENGNPFKNQGDCVSFVQTRYKSFTASNSLYYDCPTVCDHLYGTGAISFSWDKATGNVYGGYYNEVVPPTTGTTYYNVVTGGSVVGDTVNLTFSRTNPNSYGPFTFTGTLVDNVLTGTLDGPFLFTATGN